MKIKVLSEDCPKCAKSNLVSDGKNTWCPRRGCGYGLDGDSKRGATEKINKNLPKYIKKELTRETN